MTTQRQLTYGPFLVGMDNVSPETGLPEGAVRDAVNTDFDRAGDARRRRGRGALALALSGIHSGWESPVTKRSYGVVSGDLVRLHCDGSVVTTTALAAIADLPTTFDDVDDRVIFSNAEQIGVIRSDDSVISLGVEDPPAPTLGNAVGTLDPGRYAGAISFVADDGEESGLSPIAEADIADGQGLDFSIPQPIEARVSTIKLYRTEPGGSILFHANTVPVGTTECVLGGRLLGKPADNQFQVRMGPGRIVRGWNGFLLVVDDYGISISRSYRYGRTDPENDRIPYPRRVTMLEPVIGGLFVGSADGIDFYAGTKPDDLVLRRTGGKPPIEGCSGRIQGSQFGGDRVNAQTNAIWLAQDGYVIGHSDGSLDETQHERIRLPFAQHAAVGSLFIHNRRVVATLQ